MTEAARKLTLVNAMEAMVNVLGGQPPMSNTDEARLANKRHITEVSAYWPNYFGVYGETRVMLLMAAHLCATNHPDVLEAYPERVGSTMVGEYVRFAIELSQKPDSDGNPQKALEGEWATEAFWAQAYEKAQGDIQIRAMMKATADERELNPGCYKVGEQWMAFGSVFKDDEDKEVVVTYTGVMHKDQLEFETQKLENVIANLKPEICKYAAIQVVNKNGGNMFAAACTLGLHGLNNLLKTNVRKAMVECTLMRAQFKQPAQYEQFKTVVAVSEYEMLVLEADPVTFPPHPRHYRTEGWDALPNTQQTWCDITPDSQEKYDAIMATLNRLRDEVEATVAANQAVAEAGA